MKQEAGIRMSSDGLVPQVVDESRLCFFRGGNSTQNQNMRTLQNSFYANHLKNGLFFQRLFRDEFCKTLHIFNLPLVNRGVGWVIKDGCSPGASLLHIIAGKKHLENSLTASNLWLWREKTNFSAGITAPLNAPLSFIPCWAAVKSTRAISPNGSPIS